MLSAAKTSGTNCKVFIYRNVYRNIFFLKITNLILSQLYYNVENSLHILNIAYTNPNQKLKKIKRISFSATGIYIYIIGKVYFIMKATECVL